MASGESLRGVFELIAASGGGVVDSHPNDLPPGTKISPSFLHYTTRRMFKSEEFEYLRPLGAKKALM